VTAPGSVRGSADPLDELPPAEPMDLRQRITYLQYAAVWALASRVPVDRAPGIADRLGDIGYTLGPASQRRIVRMNLARVAGHPTADVLRGLTRAAYRSYARYWVDAFRAHTLDPGVVAAHSTGTGLEILDAVRDAGDGGILATGHLGSWDIGAFFSTQRGWRLTVVAEVLEPRPLFERFVRLRRQLGLEVIPLVRGGDMLSRLETAIADGGIATLLADRDLTRKGPVVEFFGEPCRLPPGPAALARRTGRPVVPGAFFTTPDGWHAIVHEPVDVAHLDVAAGTQVVAHALERLIAEAPEQWHVFVPNWLAEREPDHPALVPR
jgi:phosphatidylinositol dimannoside acyltransferase